MGHQAIAISRDMLKISYGTSEQSRTSTTGIIQYSKFVNPDYRVVDIGGVKGNWSDPYVDLIVDINAEGERGLRIDICKEKEWSKLLAIVEEQGKFDFAICTHTLEDLYNPITALDHLPLIAKSGIITMPSVRTELSNYESEFWVGFYHHRWMYDQVDGKMLVIPKTNFVDHLAKRANIVYNADTYEIQFYWKDSIPYEMFMDNYIGEQRDVAGQGYNDLIKRMK
jgi:hypothetical protein